LLKGGLDKVGVYLHFESTRIDHLLPYIFIIVTEMASILKRLGGLLPKRVQKVCISFIG
jgi:hypothetical protein